MASQDGEELSFVLERQRRRVQDFIASQRRQFAEIEARLDEHCERLAEASSDAPLSDGDAPSPQRLAEIAAQLQTLEAQRAALETLSAALDQARREMREEQHLLLEQLEGHLLRLQQRQQESDVAASELSHDRREMALLREKLQEESAELSRGRSRLEARLAEVDQQQTALAEARQRTNHQRRRLAQEFRQRQADLRQEIERRRAELAKQAEAGKLDADRVQADARRRQTQLERSLEERAQELEICRTELQELRRASSGQQHELQSLAAEKERLHDELTDSRSAANAAEQRARELDESRKQASRQLAEALEQHADAAAACARTEQQAQRLQVQLAELKQQVTQADADRGAAETQANRLRAELAAAKEAGLQSEAQCAEWRGTAERLTAELERSQAEHKVLQDQSAASPSPGAQPPAAERGDSDLERRLQMALDDLRSEKAKNADLQKKLTQSPAAAPSLPAGGNDWESQKRRLLEALEADGEATTDEQLQERLQIEDAIRATEIVVAEKDREIAELQNLLSEQSANLGSMAVGASAIADLLDQDQLVRQERQNLERLQTEWREKLSQAEIDLSVQRAKIARERAELEEKLRTYESQQGSQAEQENGGKGRGPKTGRRWLSRLGLADQDETGNG